MTNKEAIEIISRYEVNGCGYCHQGGDEVWEAFDMAINALKAKEPQVIPFRDIMTHKDGVSFLYWIIEMQRYGISAPCSYFMVRDRDIQEKVFIARSFSAINLSFKDDEYGVTWRLWTSMPSEEERKAAEWQ